MPKFVITMRDLIEFDNGQHFKEKYLSEYKLLKPNGYFSDQPLTLDDEFKLGTIHINFRDIAYFEISPRRFETFNMINAHSRTMQTLNWVKFLFKKFGKDYAPIGKEALDRYIAEEKFENNNFTTLLKEEREIINKKLARAKELINYKKAEVKHLNEQFKLCLKENKITNKEIKNV